MSSCLRCGASAPRRSQRNDSVGIPNRPYATHAGGAGVAPPSAELRLGASFESAATATDVESAVVGHLETRAGIGRRQVAPDCVRYRLSFVLAVVGAGHQRGLLRIRHVTRLHEYRWDGGIRASQHTEKVGLTVFVGTVDRAGVGRGPPRHLV